MKKIIYSVFAIIATLIGFFTALFFNFVPLAIIFAVGFTASLLWFVDMVKIHYQRDQRRQRRALRVVEPEWRRIDFADDLEVKEAEKEISVIGSVRPGSRPSITYANMRALQEGREINDNVRAEA